MYETLSSSFSKTHDQSGGVLTLSVLPLPFGREVLKHSKTRSDVVFLSINKNMMFLFMLHLKEKKPHTIFQHILATVANDFCSLCSRHLCSFYHCQSL